MLALMAGEGALPEAVLKSLRSQDRPIRLCEMDGHPVAHSLRGNDPVMRFRLETLGSFIADLKLIGTEQICFAGRISRPVFDPARIDAATEPMIGPLLQALRAGDDAALRLVTRFFEQAGISVVSATDLAPELLPPEGVLTRVHPDERAKSDVERGAEIIAALAAADVGQACVVASGQALALEAVAGTDWMLQTLAPPPPSRDPAEELLSWAVDRITQARAGYGARPDGTEQGGVLVKAAKPGQDLRFDMPTVGPQTVRGLVRAKLSGMAIEAGRVLLLDREATVDAADRAGLFIWVRP